MTKRYSTDIVIFGGGIAGCWLLNKLVGEGYQAILIENQQLGCGQTLASQGIIHGGLKYALNGALSGATNAIAAMPQRWRSCLAGDADVDLRGVSVLSEHYYMWSNAGIRSKLKTFLGSKALRGRIAPVAQSDYPDFFGPAKNKGTLYKLPDFVIETESLLAVLTAAHADRIFRVNTDSISFQRDLDGQVASVVISCDGEQHIIDTQRTLFAAGKGNQELIEMTGLHSVKMQLRPLNMVYLKSKHLTPLFLHCIGDSFSLTPTLTITSHKDRQDNTVWYLGGEIAESGVDKTEDEQINAAKSLLTELFPWLSIDQHTWGCIAIDRAEPANTSNFRPDDAFIAEEDGVIVAWPTKLTLAPSLGDMISNSLAAASISPTEKDNAVAELKQIGQPIQALAPWN